VPEPLSATQTQLEGHFAQVAEILNAAIDLEAEIQIQVDSDVSPAVAALAGNGCERISRNMGRRVQVAPLRLLHQGLWAWLSYREQWDHDRPVGGRRRFSFRSAGITIHFGWKFDEFKPQMFRAEWAGWAKWDGADHSFQGAGAGHPHWQFDALDSLPNEAASERAAMLREIIEGDIGSVVRDFAPQLPEDDIRDIIATQKLSRIHFASAAAWWKTPPNDQHAHCPERVHDLQAWLQRSLGYLVLELGRLSGPP
jgi:hypothetical protein